MYLAPQPTARNSSSTRSFAGMRRIIDRCLPWSYGNDYIPALLATRQEGRSKGRLYRVPMPKWDREMHFMSAAAMRVAVHVVYQPDFIEGLENRPCCPVPGLAVLEGHPLLIGQHLPSSSGTVLIADALGVHHPMTTDNRSEEQNSNSPKRDFYPLLMSLLGIFKHGETIRAVNLFIRKSASDLALGVRESQCFNIERRYGAEANIPTVKISEDDLHPVATNNLTRLCKMGRKPANVSEEQLAKSLVYMEDRLFISAPNTWKVDLREQLGLLDDSVFRIFHYGVFHRHLKVDLHEAVAMDRIHRRERVNVAADFASRFLEPMR